MNMNVTRAPEMQSKSAITVSFMQLLYFDVIYKSSTLHVKMLRTGNMSKTLF